MFGSWRYPGQVISDRYQFPSLLGSYTDTGAATETDSA